MDGNDRDWYTTNEFYDITQEMQAAQVAEYRKQEQEWIAVAYPGTTEAAIKRALVAANYSPNIDIGFSSLVDKGEVELVSRRQLREVINNLSWNNQSGNMENDDQR